MAQGPGGNYKLETVVNSIDFSYACIEFSRIKRMILGDSGKPMYLRFILNTT